MNDSTSPLRVALRDALQEVKAGRLPKQMVEKALARAGEQDAEGFVKQLEAIFSQPDATQHLNESQYQDIADAARRLELEELGRQVLEAGVAAGREDDHLAKRLRRYLASSSNRSVAEEGRRLLEDELGLDRSTEPWTLSQPKLRASLSDFGALMDLYERIGMIKDAEKVAAAANVALPDSSYVLRNYGRALEQAGKPEEGLRYMEAALWAAGYSDAEAGFFGAALSRRNDYRGALEAYLLAAKRDPDDADNFLRSAIALLIAREQPESRDDKQVHTLANDSVISKMIENALSCLFFDEADAERIAPLIAHATRDGFSLDETLLADPTPKPNRISLAERIRDAQEWYETMATALTRQP